MRVEQLAVPAGPAALGLLPRLARALAGGAPIAPYAAAAPPPPLPPHDPADLPADLAVVVGTSGSTGTPKRALLTTGALTASAAATTAWLGGPAQWMLALPAHHIAGLQVLLRSLDAGTTPVVMDLSAGFTTAAFVAATAGLDAGARRVTSLVPTQLVRLIDDPRAHASLLAYDAILVGGAALAPGLRRQADALAVRIVSTYGMSETAGGCVYDGLPLDGVATRIDDGRVLLGGPTLARGYLGRPDLTDEAFLLDADMFEPTRRWFRTDDLGHVEGGRLHVDGRLDDVVVTGGVKVAPRLVEEAVVEHVRGVREAVVLGLPDRQWGEVVAVLLVVAPDATHRHLTTADVRAALRGALPDHALPHRVVVADRVPLRGPGKPDRRAIRRLFPVGE